MAKILIVEDNEHMHRIYADKFRREGFVVLDASDGEQGLVLAAREKPTVILLDLMMPKMDGYQVLDRLKTDPATAEIPVLVISNKCQPADIERALALGAKNFFHKGMTLLDDLATETRRLCNLRKALIVSSRPLVADTLGKLLANFNFVSSTNSIVVETIPRAEREKPDLLFLDTHTPGLNLNLTLNRLQVSAKARSIPVVIVDDVPLGAVMASHTHVVAQLDVPIDPAKVEDALKHCSTRELQPAA
ncbi:MAG: response regulator [Verrucomicrobiae bacterium]|nr:response regulator [Verrucomicrobiae bacterium]